MRWLVALFTSLMVWLSSFASAFSFDADYYSVYEKPSTGNTVVVYLVPRTVTTILTAQPFVPFSFTPNATGYQTILYPDGSLGTFAKINYTANDMAGLGATLSSYKLFWGDFDGDNNVEFLLQGSGTRNSVVLSTDANGNAFVYYNFGEKLNAANYPTLVTGDIDHSGLWDVRVTSTSGASTVYYGSYVGYFQTAAQNAGGNNSSNSSLVGAINGKFNVDESGNSTYAVNISTAAGTAGVVPRISLNYSSGDGDGVMGTGWSIAGLSVITRCRQTLAQDGNTSAIGLGVSDRFCLDGQRLILVPNTGDYGSPGSIYRTEIDSYAVITAIGGVAGNPAYFTVVRKDGSTSYYGNGNGSQLVLNGNGPILTWAISRFQDSIGNPIRFFYTVNAAVNEQLINRIDYGYGSNMEATNNSSTYLLFNYAPRPDASSGYVAGFKTHRTQRLTSIYSYNNGSEIRRYILAYRPSSSFYPQSYVEKLSECVGSSCLSPTTFGWSLNTGKFNSAPSANISISGVLSGFRTMDINGDGKSDIVYTTSATSGSTTTYTMSYRLSSGVSFGLAQSLPANTIIDGNTNWQSIDYNNDGKQDLLIGNQGGNWNLFVGSASGFAAVGVDIGIQYTGGAFPLDVNGDGLVDLVTQTGAGESFNYHYLQQISGSSNYQFDGGHNLAISSVLQPPPSEWCDAGKPSISNTFSATDVNGDGRSDIVAQVPYYCNAMKATVMYENTTAALDPAQWTKVFLNLEEMSLPLTADFNGDGLTDLLVKGNSTGRWTLKLNTGAAGVFTTVHELPWIPTTPQILDYNADGYPDIIYAYNAGGITSSSLSVQMYDPGSQSFRERVTTNIDFTPPTLTDPGDQYVSADIDGDGHPDVLRITSSSTGNIVSVYKPAEPFKADDRIVGIDNGLGKTTTISYKPLTDTSVYTPATDANNPVWSNVGTLKPFPVFDIMAPHYVVSSVSSTAPAANNTSPNQVNYSATAFVSYQYSGLKMQASGRGLLGFASITTIDNQTGIKQIAAYRQDFPFIGRVAAITQQSASGLVFSRKEFSYASISRVAAAGTKYYQVYIPTITEQTNDPVGGWEQSYVVTQTAAPDEWGNAISLNYSPSIATTWYSSDHSSVARQTSIYNFYGSTDYEKQFSRLSSTSTIYTRPDQPVIGRTSNFSYYSISDGNLRGLLKTEQVVTLDGLASSAPKTYLYDQFGNRKCVTIGADTNTATNCTPSTGNRYEIINYDNAGRYIVDKQSAFNTGGGWANKITEQIVSRNALGLPTQVNGLNGLVTLFKYDVLGREQERSDNTGALVAKSFVRYGVAGAQYSVTTTANTGASTVQHYDVLNREIAQQQIAFDGRFTSTETEYDNIGRVKRRSMPHYSMEVAQYWSTNNYDAFRLQSQQVPATGGAAATTTMGYYFYDSPLTVTTNALGQVRLEVRNANGELTRTVDHLGNAIVYTYDAVGQLTQTTTMGMQNGASVSINTYLEYDQLGRKIKMRDSDKGTWFYQYNEFGDLTDQYKVMSSSNYTGTLAQALADSSVQKQRTHIDYDKQGRMIGRIEYRENGAVENTSIWIYDTATNGVGQLAQEGGGGLVRTYTYDTRGRSSGVIYANGSFYLLSTTYDVFGRVLTTTDTLGTGSGTRNGYNNFGYLQSVTDIASNSMVYTVMGMDARGNVTSAIYGNGATNNWNYDPGSGLLTDQITTDLFGGATLQRLNYTWDALGNQTSRWDRGLQGGTTYKDLKQSFCYDGLNRLIKTNQSSLNGGCTGTQDQQYDDFGSIISKNNVGTYTYNSASPHQLQSTSDGISYTYDKGGNLISDTSGRTLHYTVFDKADLITKGSNQIGFVYGSDRNAYKRVDSASDGTATTYYVGNTEIVVKPDNSYDVKRYIAGVALWSHHFNSSGGQTSVDRQYLHKDALGSLVLITGDGGSVKQQNTFNAWGERVNTSNWQTVLPSSNFLPVSQQFTTQSFTGQDAMDAVGLINYGGRIYDPRIARFIQADPLIGDAEDSQAYNRYAYVRNSPLSNVDPSGYDVVTAGSLPIIFVWGDPFYFPFSDLVIPGGSDVSVPLTGSGFGERPPPFNPPPPVVPPSDTPPKEGQPPKPATPPQQKPTSVAAPKVSGGVSVNALSPKGSAPGGVDSKQGSFDSESMTDGKFNAEEVIVTARPISESLPNWDEGAIDQAFTYDSLPQGKLLILGKGSLSAVIPIVSKWAPLIKKGSANGKTAGQRFSEAVKNAAKAENTTSTCVYCQMKGTATQVDHAIPKVRGGNATLDNAQLVCPHCNASKGAGDFPKTPPADYVGPWPPSHW